MDNDPASTGTTSSDYDSAYYSSNLGSEEEYSWESPEWRTFFTGVAERLVALANPATVMDVGCARGLLVQALVGRGVDAHGIDISTHAIETADPSIRDRLAVQSAEKVSGQWDLVTCIEVLEHMAPADAEAALDAMCAVSDRILFSSTPSDFAEPTHINVRPPGIWAASFAERGFFRRLDVDLSFLSPWAVLFQRAERSVREVVYGYEQWAYPVRSELLEKRSALLKASEALSDPTAHSARGVPQEEHDAVVKSLREAEHSVLTLRDAVIGAAAESASAQRALAKAEERAELAKRELAKVELEKQECAADAIAAAQVVEEMRSSTTWRVGRSLVRPLTVLKRVEKS